MKSPENFQRLSIDVQEEIELKTKYPTKVVHANEFWFDPWRLLNSKF